MFKLKVTHRRTTKNGDLWVIGEYEGDRWPAIGDAVTVTREGGTVTGHVSGAGHVQTNPHDPRVRGIVLAGLTLDSVPVGATLELPE
jgi:hypothetical protein